MSLQRINTALAHAVGLTGVRNVTGFDLRVRSDAVPRLTVHTILIDPPHVQRSRTRFRLTPIDDDGAVPVPFDLDRACAQALERVQAYVNEQATLAHRLLRIEFRTAHERLRHPAPATFWRAP
jgi:hypothetical protein